VWYITVLYGIAAGWLCAAVQCGRQALDALL